MHGLYHLSLNMLYIHFMHLVFHMNTLKKICTENTQPSMYFHFLLASFPSQYFPCSVFFAVPMLTSDKYIVWWISGNCCTQNFCITLYISAIPLCSA